MTIGNYDVIVVGVGGMGSATAFELARRGLRVLGLEQHTLGHDQGSSHGHTRIIRQAYYEHPAYVPLVQRAYERWYDLEQLVGGHLLTSSACLSIGPPGSDLLSGILASAQTHSLAVEQLSAEDLRRRFPMFLFAPQYTGVLEGSAGFLYVEDCVGAHVQAARACGAVIQDEEQVKSWKATGSGVEVETTRGSYRAGRLILTAGPWTAALLARWGRNLTVMRQVAFWFGTSQPGTFRRDRFPVYICDTPEGIFYGVPMLNANGPKVAQHYGAPELSGPAEVERSVSAADEERIRGFLREHLPEINGPCRQASVCLYTLTPDRHFVIDAHPEHPQVFVAAGFSGHGFKFATVASEILADLAETGATKWPIELFRFARL